ncbi:MAG: Rnf-Nqr domain containing protein [Oscillospiraceae bacterium]
MFEVFARIVSLAMVSVFTQNAIFDRAFGANVVIYASRKDSHVVGFTLGMTAMTTAASIVSYFLDKLVLPLEYGYLFMPLIYLGVIGLLYIAGLLFLWKFFHNTFKRVKKYAHLAIFNCAVIGALFLNSSYGSDLPSYIGYGFGTGIGFFLACFMLNIAHERLDSDKIPRMFKGYPIMLIYIGIVSLAFNVLVGYTADF